MAVSIPSHTLVAKEAEHTFHRIKKLNKRLTQKMSGHERRAIEEEIAQEKAAWWQRVHRSFL